MRHNDSNDMDSTNASYRQQPQHEQYALETYGIVLHQTRCLDASHSTTTAAETELLMAGAGTIHYVGPVASASNPTQLYAGIVWDDVSRGKHNGTVLDKSTGRLVRHFDCEAGPTAASFVKLSKVHLGRHLTLNLVRQRYLDQKDQHLEAPNNQFEHHYVQTNKGGTKPIEFYGELKLRTQQQVGVNLRHMSLRRFGICRVETTDPDAWQMPISTTTSSSSQELVHAAARVLRLDLAGNLLSTWKDVGDVLKVFCNLQELSLASNRIRDLVEKDDTLPQKSNTLVDLNLRHCHIEDFGATMVHLGQAFSALVALNLSNNPLQWGSSSNNNNNLHQEDAVALLLAQSLPSLLRLDVSECQLTREEDILVFSRLPKLESLNLDDNPGLERLPQRNTTKRDHDDIYFPSLTHLQLSGTGIASWLELEGMREFRALESLRLRSTPLSNTEGMATTRSHLVARFEQLTNINSTPVSPEERKDAQRRYVGTVAKLLAQTKTQDDKDRIFDEHPQYQTLAQQHTTAAASAANGNGSSAGSTMMLSDSLLSVTLQSMAAQSCEREPLIRRLPSSLTVGKIKALLHRQYGLDVDLQELSVKATPGDKQTVPTALDEDDRTLAYFGVADGSTIFMHERVLAQKQGEDEKAQQQLLERIKKQESDLEGFLERQKKVAG